MGRWHAQPVQPATQGPSLMTGERRPICQGMDQLVSFAGLRFVVGVPKLCEEHKRRESWMALVTCTNGAES